MNYMGSKRRIAKKILPIILHSRKVDQFYVEPFVGGGNSIDKVIGPRIGGDCSLFTIEALKLIRDKIDNIPKENSETSSDLYVNIRNNKNIYNPGVVGYYGHALSYGGKFFGGWRRDKKGLRDYINEAYRNAVKQSEKLKGVTLIHAAYDDLNFPDKSIIYCDPPYKNSITKYNHSPLFDHDKFWNWCELMSTKGHRVFVSEYTAPETFRCVWSSEIVSGLAPDQQGKKAIEKLFTIGG